MDWAALIAMILEIMQQFCPQATEEQLVERLLNPRPLDRLRLQRRARIKYGWRSDKLVEVMGAIEAEIAKYHCGDPELREEAKETAQLLAAEAIAARSTP